MTVIKAARKNGGVRMVIGHSEEPARRVIPTIDEPARPSGDAKERLAKSRSGGVTGRRLARLVLEAWVTATDRPDTEFTDAEVGRVVRALNSGFVTEANYIEVVKAASYVPPQRGDDRDLTRLLKSMRTESGLDSAVAARKNRSTGYDYAWSPKTSTTDDVLSVIGMKDFELTDKELKACQSLMSYRPATIEKMMNKAKSWLGQESVLPSEVLAVGRKRVDGLKDQTGVVQGRAVSETLADNLVRYDVLANDMLYAGDHSVDDVIAFHHRHPREYWEDVKALALERLVEPFEVYDSLSEKWPNINPMDPEASK